MTNIKRVIAFGAMACMGAISGCSQAEKQETPPQRTVGMANPASVYCLSLKGQLDTVQGENGVSGYCTLPNGERIEEWTLFRRDHPQK